MKRGSMWKKSVNFLIYAAIFFLHPQYFTVRSSLCRCIIFKPVLQPIIPLPDFFGSHLDGVDGDRQNSGWFPKPYPHRRTCYHHHFIFTNAMCGRSPQLSGGQNNAMSIFYIFPHHLTKEKPVLDKELYKSFLFFLIHRFPQLDPIIFLLNFKHSKLISEKFLIFKNKDEDFKTFAIGNHWIKNNSNE